MGELAVKNIIKQLNKLGQSIWYDNIDRNLIKSGKLQDLIDLGVSGLTSNPTIFEKAISGSSDYDYSVFTLTQKDLPTKEIYEHLIVEDICEAADMLRPIFSKTNGLDGYVSLEVNPHLANDTEGTIIEAKRLFEAVDRPNLMIKVPATSAGIPAIRTLIAQGINVNVTLIFSLDVYTKVREAYISGLEDFHKNGGDLSKVASVASFFVSRVDTAVDSLLRNTKRNKVDDVNLYRGKAALLNAQLAYQQFTDSFGSERFMSLKKYNANPQRPLWASTSTKNPDYDNLLYVESLVANNTVNTLPDNTLDILISRDELDNNSAMCFDDPENILTSMETTGINMDEITDKLLLEGVKSFADSFDKLIVNLNEKRNKLIFSNSWDNQLDLLNNDKNLNRTLARLKKSKITNRIWELDHTVWKSDPTNITDRLGWLTIIDQILNNVSSIEHFAEGIHEAGFRYIVILGMGGSTLVSEALRNSFSNPKDSPKLIVLNSTLPDQILSVTETIDITTTLFIISSKSGNTVETMSLYKHFKSMLDEFMHADQVGRRFIAITDSGTPLENLANQENFRQIFINPSNIGGRYSALSYFGLVPAALIRIDIRELLNRAKSMHKSCSIKDLYRNPGVFLGTAMASMAISGHDKLTLVTSPGLRGFASWIEHLIAESTGKEEVGIIPIVGPHSVDVSNYGDDRLFIYLRLDYDQNDETDDLMRQIKSIKKPMVYISLNDKYDLGTEFFRWEFATAISGAILGINPFDQPHVQQAKDLTIQLLNEYQTSGEIPSLFNHNNINVNVQEFLDSLEPRDYLAIIAYVQKSPEMDHALSCLRECITQRYNIATTVGYGPSVLHTTGQLHKGGPQNGRVLQIVATRMHDIAIPGKKYTFGILTETQARGDLLTLTSNGRFVSQIKLDAGNAENLNELIENLM